MTRAATLLLLIVSAAFAAPSPPYPSLGRISRLPGVGGKPAPEEKPKKPKKKFDAPSRHSVATDRLRSLRRRPGRSGSRSGQRLDASRRQAGRRRSAAL